jgi:DNA transposition AAA+ family ATPase
MNIAPTNEPQPGPIQRNTLIDRERIRGASRMIPEGTDVSTVTPEQIQQVAADVELFAKTHKISQKDIGRAIGYKSPGVISEFLKGTYKGAVAQLAMDLEGWLVEEEHRRSQPATTQFVWTNVAMEIKAVAGYCLDKRKVGMVYGPDTSGLGKTTALRAIHQELGPRRSALVTIDKVDANPTGVLVKILKALGLSDNGSNKNRFERICDHLAGRAHLLLIDQAHNLRGAKDDKPFYHLMDLYDRVGSAQLWCGTADLVAYLTRQRAKNADESLAQVCSRIFPRVDLMESLRLSNGDGGEPLVTIDQVREMFARNKLKLTSAAARFLCELANQPDSGCLRLCVQMVEYATMLAEFRRAASIDVPLLQEALRKGLTSDRAITILAKSHNEPIKAIARSA